MLRNEEAAEEIYGTIMTDNSSGIRYIETARVTSEERMAYAERNQAMRKQGHKRNTRRTSASTLKLYFSR